MPPSESASTTPPIHIVKVTNEASYLFGKIGKVISATEHEIVVLFEDAEQKIKETFEPKHVETVKPAAPVAPAKPSTPPAIVVTAPPTVNNTASPPPPPAPVVPATTTPPVTPAA